MDFRDPNNSVAPAATGFGSPLVHELAVSVYGGNGREERGSRPSEGTSCTPPESCWSVAAGSDCSIRSLRRVVSRRRAGHVAVSYSVLAGSSAGLDLVLLWPSRTAARSSSGSDKPPANHEGEPISAPSSEGVQPIQAATSAASNGGSSNFHRLAGEQECPRLLSRGLALE